MISVKKKKILVYHFQKLKVMTMYLKYQTELLKKQTAFKEWLKMFIINNTKDITETTHSVRECVITNHNLIYNEI